MRGRVKVHLQLDGALEELESDVVLLLQREAVAHLAGRVNSGAVTGGEGRERCAGGEGRTSGVV